MVRQSAGLLRRRANERREEEGASERVKAFLNAAHGFESSDKKFSRRTRFGTVLVAAINAELVSKGTLMRDFGISTQQLDRAKIGRSTDVPKDTRDSFIATMKERAALALA